MVVPFYCHGIIWIVKWYLYKINYTYTFINFFNYLLGFDTGSSMTLAPSFVEGENKQIIGFW